MKLSKIQEDFDILREHCIQIRRNFNTYEELYFSGHDQILRDIAGWFFHDLSEILTRDWILQVCKLMDPASTNIRGKCFENITILLIDQQLRDIGLFDAEISKVSQSIRSYGEKLKPARHKCLAHLDREHCINGITLGETTEQELFDFLENIQMYCDLVGEAIGSGPVNFRSTSGAGDVGDLLKVLTDRNNA
ncbi:hypothetical protein M5236_004984 [Vibrio parahaemolyticus]|nr:hypothetical protein [Vibrio parahaemolyticus]EJE8676222.1 hypothetical protein [Vibrio parahaemolyticus]